MQALLKRFKPKDSTDTKWEEAWDNSGYALEPLYKALEHLKQEIETINKDDFNCPNHYAKLMWREGQLKAYNTIIGLLPDSAKP
jgi:hypothetical protein